MVGSGLMADGGSLLAVGGWQLAVGGLLAETDAGGTWPLIAVATVFILAIVVGLEVISKVPQVLHTPLMSATNAIHGVILVGGILILGKAEAPLMYALGIAAVLFGTLNVVGGYAVTDRMLEMFKARKSPPPTPSSVSSLRSKTKEGAD